MTTDFYILSYKIYNKIIFRGFSRDFDGQQNEIVLFTPKYTLSGKYIVNGTMFSVPIHASGSSTIILC